MVVYSISSSSVELVMEPSSSIVYCNFRFRGNTSGGVAGPWELGAGLEMDPDGEMETWCGGNTAPGAD